MDRIHIIKCELEHTDIHMHVSEAKAFILASKENNERSTHTHREIETTRKEWNEKNLSCDAIFFFVRSSCVTHGRHRIYWKLMFSLRFIISNRSIKLQLDVRADYSKRVFFYFFFSVHGFPLWFRHCPWLHFILDEKSIRDQKIFPFFCVDTRKA